MSAEPPENKTDFQKLHARYQNDYLTVFESLTHAQHKLDSENCTPLSFELWLHVLKYLRPKQLFAFALTSKFFFHIFERDDIWRRLVDPSDSSPMVASTSWKLKFKYNSGKIIKQGILEEEGGLFWSTWNPVWVAVAGVNFYLWREIQNVGKREKELRDMGKLGINAFITYHPPTLVIPLHGAMLFRSQQADITDRRKFNLRKEPLHSLQLSAKNQVASEWITILVRSIQSLARDFKCEL